MPLTLVISALAAALALPLAAVGPDEISRFSEEVETLRGLEFRRPVEHRMLARSELRTFLGKHIENELPMSIDTYIATLEALHLVDSSASMDAMLDLHDAQVLAFYDPVGDVYYSLDAPPDDVFLPPAMADAVIVHELVHALQEQHFGIGRRILEIQSNWDAALAYQAVLEGEALLVMIAYLGRITGVSLDDLAAQRSVIDAVRESVATGNNVSPDVPAYFVESMKFPYAEGLSFVFDLYLNGGWAAVDAVHREPPRSTRELIRPAIYHERLAAADTTDEKLLAEPTDSLVETVFGEFHWAFLLGSDAAAGWADDVVSVRHGEGGVTVLVDSTWINAREAETFELAYRVFLDGKDAPNRIISRTGTRVKAAYGADANAARGFAGGKGVRCMSEAGP